MQLDEGLLLQGMRRHASFPMKLDPNNANKGVPPSLTMEVAMKIQKSGHVSYFSAPLPFYVLFLEGAPTPEPTQAWATPGLQSVEAVVMPWPANAAQVLAKRNIVPLGQDFYSLVTSTGSNCLVHASAGKVQIRCAQRPVLPFVLDAISALLREAAAGGASASSGISAGGAGGLLDLF